MNKGTSTVINNKLHSAHFDPSAVWNVSDCWTFVTRTSVHPSSSSSSSPPRLNCRLLSFSGSCDAMSLKSRKMSWNVSSSPEWFQRGIITELPLTSYRDTWEGKCSLTCSSKDLGISHLFIHPRHPQPETLQPTLRSLKHGKLCLQEAD